MSMEFDSDEAIAITILISPLNLLRSLRNDRTL